ncbi:MAG: hypothetical protein JSV51_07015 [Candidatus Bathyarchaeota archaeon]|nr:MAG: hypothetical protein JSV51_07015 [Candidatus Bathyarchaeota archaeon]
MKPESLACPYSRCGRLFKQPVMVTDHSKLPRETYYACPHCMLRLELLVDTDEQDGLEHVLVKAVNDTIFSGLNARDKEEAVSSPHATRPSKSCRHFLGHLRCLDEDADIPDECAVCPSIVQCYVKR